MSCVVINFGCENWNHPVLVNVRKCKSPWGDRCSSVGQEVTACKVCSAPDEKKQRTQACSRLQMPVTSWAEMLSMSEREWKMPAQTLQRKHYRTPAFTSRKYIHQMAMVFTKLTFFSFFFFVGIFQNIWTLAAWSHLYS